MELADLILDVDQHIEIKAPIDQVYEKMVHRFSDEHTLPDKTPFPLTLEPFPGGRWFRDLGDGVGHLWGHVQVIKPPALIEIQGPLFMSYPVSGHLALRLTEIDGGTRFSLRHRALGMIEQNHREGVNSGWGAMLADLKQICE